VPVPAPPGFRVRRELMDGERIARALARIAHQIVERPRDAEGLVLVGVRTRGVPLARRLARLVAEAGAPTPPVGALDITLYRDDLTTVAPQPVLRGTEIPGSIDGRTVVLVDDVLYTGRTVRAALDEIIDFGRPARIKLAALVDRGHRELPICPDYVGQSITTSRDEIVQVLLEEQDGADRVLLLERAAPARRPARPRSSRTRKKRGRRA
jgi:pyrimidine operon attenuation protein/uracil phosphoribosyltransferase